MPESKLRVVSDRVIQYRHVSTTNPIRQERELDRMTGVSPAKKVDILLKHMVPLLIDAARSNRTWLEDFADDTVRIDADLYEVLLAYQHMRRQQAA